MKKETGNMEDIGDVLKEYIMCRNSFTYFCRKYITMPDKEEKVCAKCDCWGILCHGRTPDNGEDGQW